MKVLLAVGNESLSAILKNRLSQERFFTLSKQEVFHLAFLEEIVESEMPNILILHETYLENSFSSREEREQGWINLLKKIRFTYEDQIRIVFLCERVRGDSFLSKLVSINILDIFNQRSIDTDSMIEQLMDKPRYSRAAKLLGDDVAFSLNPAVESIQNEEPAEEVETKKEKTVIKKTIEKKVINKQVIKREFHLNFQSQIEKVVGITIERKLILVHSPFHRSGCTFFSHHLAKQIHQQGINVAYIENPFQHPYTFDRFHGKKHADEDYLSIFHAYTQERADFPPREELVTYFDQQTSQDSTFKWEHEGVKIIALHPEKEKPYADSQIDFMKFTKILLSLQKTPYVIVDVGNDMEKDLFQELNQLADITFTILNPDIPNLERYHAENNYQKSTTKKRQIEGDHYLVGNQFSAELAAQLLEKGSFIIPQIPTEDIYEAQHIGTFLYQKKDLNSRITKVFHPILERILPPEFLKKKQKEASLFTRFLNRKIKITEIEGGH